MKRAILLFFRFNDIGKMDFEVLVFLREMDAPLAFPSNLSDLDRYVPKCLPFQPIYAEARPLRAFGVVLFNFMVKSRT